MVGTKLPLGRTRPWRPAPNGVTLIGSGEGDQGRPFRPMACPTSEVLHGKEDEGLSRVRRHRGRV